jgi:hypothetical protein
MEKAIYLTKDCGTHKKGDKVNVDAATANDMVETKQAQFEPLAKEKKPTADKDSDKEVKDTAADKTGTDTETK